MLHRRPNLEEPLSQPPSKRLSVHLMSLITLGGNKWSPELVGWGAPGRRPQREMLGCPAKQGIRGRPRKTNAQLQSVNVWPVHAVYALYADHSVVYVGEGNLGDRLLKHLRSDSLAGRWNSFSWLSPWEYTVSQGGTPAAVNAPAAFTPISDPKILVELLQLVVIRLADPGACQGV